MTSRGKTKKLIPTVFIIIMIAAIVLPIGAFFGFYVQKQNRLEELDNNYNKLVIEFQNAIDKVKLLETVQNQKKLLSQALIELKNRNCESEAEEDEIWRDFFEKIRSKITEKVETSVRTAKLKEFDKEIVYTLKGRAKTNELWELLSVTTHFGQACLRCVNTACSEYGMPVVKNNEYIKTQEKCDVCGKFLKSSIVPKLAYFEKFNLDPFPVRDGGKHIFEISFVVPIVHKS